MRIDTSTGQVHVSIVCKTKLDTKKNALSSLRVGYNHEGQGTRQPLALLQKEEKNRLQLPEILPQRYEPYKTLGQRLLYAKPTTAFISQRREMTGRKTDQPLNIMDVIAP